MKLIFGVVLAKFPRASAGHTCATMNWALAFQEMGWDVWLVEELERKQREVRDDGSSLQEDFWVEVCEEFGFSDRQVLIVDGSEEACQKLREVAADADLFFNYSGQFHRLDLLGRGTLRVYMDMDPGFTQLWAQVYGKNMNFAGHDRFLTVGTNFSGDDVLVPPTKVSWVATVPPVPMDYWRRVAGQVQEIGCFTTVAHWYGYSDVEWEGRTYGGKRHSLLQMRELPQKLGQPVRIATDLQPSWGDYDEFVKAGWEIVPSSEVCRDVPSYLRFVGGSLGEVGIAKLGYVVSRAGWMSDRSVIYLAMGRPVALQETGWSGVVEPGAGLLPFETVDDAARQLREFLQNYAEHRAGAESLARTIFSPRRVIGGLMKSL